MSKKAHKKLRDIQRLQALYGNPAMPNFDSVQMPTASAAVAAPTVHHIVASNDHVQVSRDLKSLFVLMIVMVAALIGVYWLVGHTGLASHIISIGRHVSSK